MPIHVFGGAAVPYVCIDRRRNRAENAQSRARAGQYFSYANQIEALVVCMLTVRAHQLGGAAELLLRVTIYLALRSEMSCHVRALCDVRRSMP